MSDWTPDQFEFDEAEFSGQARLFPLPDLVLFPHIMQPLHVFEARYRQMVQDALAGDRLIAIAHLLPGWVADYEGRPPLDPVACLGRIVTEHQLEDGRYNILLVGLRRIEIVREVDNGRDYRTGDVTIVHDDLSAADKQQRQQLRDELLASFGEYLPVGVRAQEKISALLHKLVPLSVVVDLIAFTADFPVEFKQSLLAEANVVSRAERLLEQLTAPKPQHGAWSQSGSEFPPPFSEN